MALRTGHFQKDLALKAKALNSSIAIDQRMVQEDIAGSVAHVHMLAKCGIIEEGEQVLIEKALEAMKTKLASGVLPVDPDAEDIHMFIEEQLIKMIGTVGKKVHTARSRNDQVALDLRLYLIKKTQQQVDALKELIQVLINHSKASLEVIMPGFTHLQAAQPVSLAHHLMAYVQMFKRDLNKLTFTLEELDECPLGSGALAGSTLPIDRTLVMKELGFSTMSENSMDAISNRDYVLQLSHALCMIQMHFSRLCEELILWNSQGYQFLSIDESYATGSSMMPQKKNPDMAELIRGKSGRVFGNHQALLTLMKGLPMTYNKDMQEDKELIFDSVDTVLDCTQVLSGMMESMTFHADKMAALTEKSLLNATDCADYLVAKGIPFREAYEIVGKLCHYCKENALALEDLSLFVFKHFSENFQSDVYEAISIKGSLHKRVCHGSPAPAQVIKQIERMSTN